MTIDSERLLVLGQQIASMAHNKGADVAEVAVRQSQHLSTKVRLQEPELVEEAGSLSAGLRVIKNERVALTATSDLSDAGIRRLVDDALELVKLAEPDPFAAPPEASLLASQDEIEDLDLYDPSLADVDAAQAIERAKRGEKAAFDADARIKNSEGASFSRVEGASALVTTGGFEGTYQGTYASLSVQPVVDDADGKKRRDVAWTAERHLRHLRDEVDVGKEAAQKVLERLGPRKIPSQEVAVIFDPDAGRGLLGLFASCISGGAVWRKSSYLAEREGAKIASALVNIIDDPLLPRAPGSRPFDGEGLLSRRNVVVDKGVLKTFLLDSYSARKLNKKSTASASRGGAGSVGVSTTNFILQPGNITRDELLKKTDRAFYVTDTMGFGFNAVTGDFSRGASGFWVERGEFKFPVSEVTISLNFSDFWQRIDAVASDLDFRSSVAVPTFRVSSMIIAGE